jgi:dGTPase
VEGFVLSSLVFCSGPLTILGALNDGLGNGPDRFVVFSDALGKAFLELKRHLRKALYEHPHVQARNAQAEPVIGDLFRAYAAGRKTLPEHVRGRFAEDGEIRAIADYVAGMTDRFALAEHASLEGAS